MKPDIDVRIDKSFKLLGRRITLIKAKLDKNNAYVGFYRNRSYSYRGRFYSVNVLPFLSLQLVVNRLPKPDHRNPVSPEGWFADGISWGDQ